MRTTVLREMPRRQSGIALLLLLALVSIMGFGLAAVGTFWHTTAQREKEKELLFIGQQFRAALRSYAGKGPGTGQDGESGQAMDAKRYPETLEALLLDVRTPAIRRHLRRIYVDPLTGKNEWGLIRRDGRIIGVYSLAHGVPLIRAGFPDEMKQFEDAASYADWRFQAEAAVKNEGDGADGIAPPTFDPDQHQVSTGSQPQRAPRVEDATQKCERLQERAVEQCWSDINTDDENNRCQDDAQRQYWECLKDRAQ